MMSPITVYRSPALYDANNLPMLRDAKLSLNKYFHLLRWKQGERIVDIGCGTGNVMTQILEPRLPADYKLLVVGPHITEFQYSTDLNGDLTKLMSDAGFIVESCEHFTVYYDTQWPDDKMMILMKSGNPYVQAIPEELHSDYFKDLYSFYKKYQYEKYAKTGTPYTVAVIVASKPSD